MRLRSPGDYSRRILLAVTGLSPQVVTETIYALAVDSSTPFVPTEIHLITTAEGKQRAELALLSEEPGWFFRLCQDYGLPSIRFDAEQIHCVDDADGSPLEDVCALDHNERLADLITDQVRRLTSDNDSALHASIAGGRKTMGFYLGYALSLFGRPQDRLSHVLVNDPFESSWEFFYPTPNSKVITTRDNKLADSKEARVVLADIPFVRMRQGMTEPLLQGRIGYSEAVALAARNIGQPHVKVDIGNRCIVAKGQRIGMTPAQIAFYALFAQRARRRLGPLNHRSRGLVADYLERYAQVQGPNSGFVERLETRIGSGDPVSSAALEAVSKWFDETKSRTNRTIRQMLGAAFAGPYEIRELKNDGYAHFGLDLKPESIEFA